MATDFTSDDNLIVYGIVMVLISLVGIVGNVLFLLVLRHPDNRKDTMSPFLVNLSVAGIFIAVAGHPTLVYANLSNGKFLYEHQGFCNWSAFSNGTVGITSFGTITLMSLTMYRTLKNNLSLARRSKGMTAVLISSTWIYGICTNLPPLVGWNKFVPGKAGISCAPDWTSSSLDDVTYIVLLMIVGFLVPVTVISCCYYKIYRIVSDVSPAIRGDSCIQERTRRVQMKVSRMIAMSATALLLSWLPYAVVSCAAMFKGNDVLTTGEAEIPELLAKASIIYNPIVYTAMNAKYTATLKKILKQGFSVAWLPQFKTVSYYDASRRRNSAVKILQKRPNVVNEPNNGIIACDEQAKVHCELKIE